jgi:hypothetical protein
MVGYSPAQHRQPCHSLLKGSLFTQTHHLVRCRGHHLCQGAGQERLGGLLPAAPGALDLWLRGLSCQQWCHEPARSLQSNNHCCGYLCRGSGRVSEMVWQEEQQHFLLTTACAVTALQSVWFQRLVGRRAAQRGQAVDELKPSLQ